MSRELLDKILEGDFKEANTVYESEMAEIAMDDIEALEISENFDGDFSLFEDEDIQELVDEILFHLDECLVEGIDTLEEDVWEDEIIDMILDEALERGLIDEKSNLGKIVKRVSSRTGHKVRRKKKCGQGRKAVGTKCVKIGGAQRMKMKKTAKKVQRKLRSQAGKQRMKKKKFLKSLKRRVQKGLKKTG